MALSELVSEKSEGIEEIINHLCEELIAVEAKIKEEMTIP